MKAFVQRVNTKITITVPIDEMNFSSPLTITLCPYTKSIVIVGDVPSTITIDPRPLETPIETDGVLEPQLR